METIPRPEETLATKVDETDHDFYINHFYFGIHKLNGNRKIDLFLAMAKQTDPPIVTWLLHFVASVILRDGTMNYRGANFISEVTPTNLTSFLICQTCERNTS